MIGMEQRLNLRLAQKLVMTPNLQLAIRLLQLNKMELVEAINAELQENPALDLEAVAPDPLVATSSVGSISSASDDGSEPSSDFSDNANMGSLGDMDWESYFDNGADYGYVPSEEKNPFSYENIVHRSETLSEHLLWQLSLARLTSEEEQIGVMIIGNIDDDGYLSTSIEEIAKKIPTSEETVLAILRIIQQFDPVGIGARNLIECLTIQVRQAEFDQNPLAEIIIREHLNKLERNSYKEIAKELQVTLEEVIAAADFIRTLEPKPGRAFNQTTTQYIQPDVYIYKIDEEYKIVLNEQGLPKLKINKLYQRYKDDATDASTRQYVEQKFRNALWLIKSVEQRQRTIHKVAESILKFQRAFFDNGIKELRPLVLRDVAEDIGMHESTISRVSTNKYMYTPQGIFEIKFFFHSGLSTLAGEDVSSIRVKEMIKNLVLNENPRSPLSDREIMKNIQNQGIQIARRTIAKYREELKIPPSSRRRSF